MMKKSHVKVFVRTRPAANRYDGLKVHRDGESIAVAFPKEESSGLINNQLDSLSFKFDGVLENASQEAVYSACVHDAVNSALSGYNATVFCYGQTGAGKTFTMSGDAYNYSARGIIPRAMQHVFREADLRTDRMYRIHVSYMEIHNEQLIDLLSDAPGASDRLAILDDDANTVVRGLTQVEVRSEEAALGQFFLGEQGRSTAPHVLNGNSSRSHALFTLHIETRTSEEASERAVVSKLHLVDLAGSERTKKTNASGEQLREASCINKSLSFLEQVVNALARKDAHVPFRQSKLTAALRDALGGNCRTVMIANLWPQSEHLEESVSTLRFGSRVRCLETEAVVNESTDPGLAARKAERQIRELRQELAMLNMLSGRGRVAYEDLSESEQLELQQLVSRYLSGRAELSELPVDSLKRIRETYKAFKAVATGWAAATGQLGPAAAAAASAAAHGGTAESDSAGVGDVDVSVGGGFAIGTAPLQARPPPASPRGHAAAPAEAAPAAARAGSPVGQQQQQFRPLSGALVRQQQAATQQQLKSLLDLDRNALFSKYKHSVPAGRGQAECVKQQQQQLADLRQALKEASAQVNSSKSDIDALTAQLQAKKLAAPTAGSSSGAADAADESRGDVLDSETYSLVQQLKQAKAKYRLGYEELQELRSRHEPATDSLAAAKQELLAGFHAWAASQDTAAGQQQIAAWHGSPDRFDDDELEDPGEAFDKLQLARQEAVEPDSAAFYAAAKQTSKLATLRAAGAASPTATRNRTGGL